jgi:hypothetical protein
VGDTVLHAFRHEVTEHTGSEELGALAGRGVQVLAVRRRTEDGAAGPPSTGLGGLTSAPLEPGDSIIVSGPPDALRTMGI